MEGRPSRKRKSVKRHESSSRTIYLTDSDNDQSPDWSMSTKKATSNARKTQKKMLGTKKFRGDKYVPLKRLKKGRAEAAGSSKAKGTKGRSKQPKETLVSEALECCICLSFAISPIQNCSNGHITCGICTSRLAEKKCPMCKAPLSLSVLGERMAKRLELKIKCDFQPEGCKENVASTDMKKHLEKCFYRNVVCNETAMDLCSGKKVDISKYATHLQVNHGFLLNDGPKMEFSISGLKKYSSKDLSINVRMPIGLIKYKNKVFMKIAYQKHDCLYIWVVYPGSKLEADKYLYRIKAVSTSSDSQMKKVSIAWTSKVFPYHSEFSYKKISPLFACFAIPSLLPLGVATVTSTATTYTVQFVLEILQS